MNSEVLHIQAVGQHGGAGQRNEQEPGSGSEQKVHSNVLRIVAEPNPALADPGSEDPAAGAGFLYNEMSIPQRIRQAR